jgi:homoserine O-acetyltransferase
MAESNPSKGDSQQPETPIDFMEIPEFVLSSGKKLKDVVVAYQTHGVLTEAKDNAVLVFHALSGSAHIAGFNKTYNSKNKLWAEDCHKGWWGDYVGEGKVIDTKKNFVICQNILGGCYGTTGPSSINPKTNKQYGSAFPDIEIEDIIRLQKAVLEKLGVTKLKCVIGSSMGGYAALEYLLLFGEDVEKAIIVGSAARTSSLNKMFGFEQIVAIENDPLFSGGDYYGKEPPDKGLMLARMIAGKTYVDIETVALRAKEEVILSDDYFYNYRLRHNIESYMFHQVQKFVKRFDANTYLKIVKAIQNFDLARKYGKGVLSNAFSLLRGNKTRCLVVTIDSDICYYPEEQAELVSALRWNALPCSHVIVNSKKGHDSFLIEPEKYGFIKEFLDEEITETGKAPEYAIKYLKSNYTRV